MIKLWRKLICPLMEAAKANRILEIGAEYGTSTAVLLKYVTERKGHLSCIDPSPEFDPSDLEKTSPGSFRFYRDLSLRVIPSLKPFDAALVDGDHNWYTVYHELNAIETLHRDEAQDEDGLNQPLIFVHDISWPYGRRDLYYDPAQIPNEYRHGFRVGGLLPNRSELCGNAGMNTSLHHACHEGGGRNGVLTAVEDYLSKSKLRFHFFQYPLYFGLGILVTEARLEATPALSNLLREYESVEGAKRIATFAEHLRSVDGVMMQTIGRKLLATEQRLAELEKKMEDQRAAENTLETHLPDGEKIIELDDGPKNGAAC